MSNLEKEHAIIRLEGFIRYFIPSGWKEPIGKVMPIPVFLISEIQGILNGDIPARITNPNIRQAIFSWIAAEKCK